MKVSGVYTICLKGTSCVYVGEAADIQKRWLVHRDAWVWPNEAEYTVIRDMPNSTKKARTKVETALTRLLKSRGFLLLSNTQQEVGMRGWRFGGITKLLSATLEQRQVWGRAGAAKLFAQSTAEERQKRSAKALSAKRKVSPEEHGERVRKGWAKQTPEQRQLFREKAKAAWLRRAGAA